MKYAVVGLGAIGSIVGGFLSKHNEDVTLIGKTNQIDVIHKKGLKIVTSKSEIMINGLKISDDYSSIKDADVVFICVKSQDTKKLLEEMKDFIDTTTVIVSLQNGVKNKEIINGVVDNKVLSTVVLFNSLYTKTGEVKLSIKGGILLEHDQLYSKKIAETLTNVGIKTTVVKKIDSFQWSKLILNLQIAVTALTNQTVKESISTKESRQIIVETMKEGIDIVAKAGIEIETLPELDPKKIIKRLSSLNSFILKIGSSLLGVSDTARNSMWQSLERGKNTEIDYINGEIVLLATKNNTKSPINSKLVFLIKKLEKQKSKKFIEPQELKDMLDL